MVYDPSSFSGLTRQVLGQLFPHYRLASLEAKSDPQEQERMFRRTSRGMKQDLDQKLPAQPQEQIPHHDFRHTTENENAGREQVPLYRGGKNVTPNAAPPKPHERLLPTPEGGPPTNSSWLEDALPGTTQLALGDEAGDLSGKNVKYSIGHGATEHQTPILDPAGDIGAALGIQRKMLEILNLPTTIHGKAE